MQLDTTCKECTRNCHWVLFSPSFWYVKKALFASLNNSVISGMPVMLSLWHLRKAFWNLMHKLYRFILSFTIALGLSHPAAFQWSRTPISIIKKIPLINLKKKHVQPFWFIFISLQWTNEGMSQNLLSLSQLNINRWAGNNFVTLLVSGRDKPTSWIWEA